jgi:Subtilase family
VHVVKDLPNPNNPAGTDEGRAMMQIVHDVAPDASLSFYTAFVSQQDFAAGILALANAGCSVICDDVGYFAEPFYQTGVIGNAIQTVEQEGVIYLTSAGNSDAVGYQAAWNPIQTATVGSTVLHNTQDFGNGSPTQTVTVGASQNVANATFAVQWNQPYGAVTSNLEVVVFLNNVVVSTVTGNGRDPYILFTLPQGNTYTIAIQNLSGPNPGLIKEVAVTNSRLVTINGANSGTTQGHVNSPYALAVGAVDAANTPGLGGTLQSENFSATGAGTQLWFNNDGSAIPGGPLVYNPVAISGIDDINTTVPGFDPFFGTSAAAPSVAGVVADMLQANPNLTFARVKQILQQTALPFGDQNIAGAGLVNAAAAVQLALQTANTATTANLVLRTNALDPAGLNQNLNQNLYRMYNVGSNALLAAAQLGRVGSDWGFVTLGGFFDGDTADMLLRNSTSGAFQVYNIAPNSTNLTGSASLGAVGLNWQFSGIGNFSSLGETDMILRDSNSGGFQVYDISNNQITGTSFMGTVGLEWQVGGFGSFSSRAGAGDMILRNTTTGGLQVYNIDHNQITGTDFMGTVGLDWQASGVGNFSSISGESDMILRNVNTGGLELYNIAHNQITGSAFLGTVGLDWQFAGIAPVHGPGTSDLVLRNVNTGAFQVYNIANNQITGAAPLGSVGLDWQLGGFAADPPAASMGSSDASTSRLVQAMAGFGGGAADTSNTALLGVETSQQALLMTPQHV